MAGIDASVVKQLDEEIVIQCYIGLSVLTVLVYDAGTDMLLQAGLLLIDFCTVVSLEKEVSATFDDHRRLCVLIHTVTLRLNISGCASNIIIHVRN